METIHFFKEDCKIDLRALRKYKNWLNKVASFHGHNIIGLNYIFCSDPYLYKINVEYLNHDTYTDIITFDLQEQINDQQLIEGDIFISLDRVQENAKTLNLPFETELSRVMAHGLLHLIGFKDKTTSEQETMREQENKAIELL